MDNQLILKVENVYKKYRLGTIGGGTLTGDLQSWWAKIRHKEDPNSKIGSKVYAHNEEFYALNGINFEVKKGEALGIIGGNGAGKSTTLKLLSQVTAPTDGKIYLNGRIASMLEVGTGFHPELTGRENIYMNGAILGMTKSEIDAKIEDIIDFSECRQFIDTPVKRYSSGMYVKLAFSVAAHLDAEIMIMDEVLAVGDMAFQQKCIEKMSSLSKKDHRTILYVSHNMNTIRQLCDRCIVLEHGKIVFEGDVEESIRIYLNSSANKYGSEIDLSLLDRPSNHTGDTFMKHFAYTNSNDCIYYVGDDVKFFIDWYSKKDFKNVKFKLIVRNSTDVPVGVSVSNDIENIRKDIDYKTDFSFNISNLTEGKYYVSISIFQTDDFGNDLLLDHITRAISFTVINKDDSSLVWQERYWGNIRFNDMIAITEEIN